VPKLIQEEKRQLWNVLNHEVTHDVEEETLELLAAIDEASGQKRENDPSGHQRFIELERIRVNTKTVSTPFGDASAAAFDFAYFYHLVSLRQSETDRPIWKASLSRCSSRKLSPWSAAERA
jgi:hypothetical protein